MAELFIVGVGRSGTSLLQSMLAAHPEIAMLPETGFFRRYCAGRVGPNFWSALGSAFVSASGGGRSGGPVPAPGGSGSAAKGALSGAGASDLADGHAERYDDDVTRRLIALRARDERLQRIAEGCWLEAVERLRSAEAVEADNPGTGAIDQALLVELYRALLSREVAAQQAGRAAAEIRFTADKDPRLVEYLPLLKRAFPESHIVHIVRDPRDVLLSKSTAEWSRHRSWPANLAAGRFQLDLADTFAGVTYGWRYHLIRYEDLIAYPERTLRRLVNSLDLDYREEMLAFSDAAARLTSESDTAWKRETAGPLLSGNSGKWQAGLSGTQVRATEAVLKRWFQRYGYERSARYGIPGAIYRVVYGAASRIYRSIRLRALKRAARELSRGDEERKLRGRSSADER